MVLPPSLYEAILAEYLDIMKYCFLSSAVQHYVAHTILSTGPILLARPRRFPGERLAIAHRELDHMLELGLIRPFSSFWA